MTNRGGGPVSYLAFPPCPSNPQLALYVPEAVLDSVSDEQRLKIAAIQTDFAHRVSGLLSRAYAEIAETLRGKAE